MGSALGDVAALVYESIERGCLSPTTAAIVRSTGLSRTAVEIALEVEDVDSDFYWIPPSENELELVGTLWRVA